jgi:hypothetical protein
MTRIARMARLAPSFALLCAASAPRRLPRAGGAAHVHARGGHHLHRRRLEPRGCLG